MDWSRTKTIFIITFLFLNVFLGYQFAEIRSAENIGVQTESTFQDLIEEYNIEFEIEEAEETLTGSPISGIPRGIPLNVLEEEYASQSAELINETLHSVLETPYQLTENDISGSVNAFLEQYVYSGQEYHLAGFNEEEGYLGLHQTYEGRPIGHYEAGPDHIRLMVNEELEITDYYQTYMVFNEEGQEEDLLTPQQVIEILINNNYISELDNAVIREAMLGYYSLLETRADFRFYIPMWRIRVNDEFFYISAIEGEVQPID
ncbi:two-component system regulatory protein YycI [Evansella clarkii]|uniref:two-component system regulatory protein YycI n=1 Tax=Evansella clarkii TaxID=79879 RepID=UPI00099839AE|nr:two-component system regulatory protein YycI [Evansella clarkii]